MPRPVSVKTLIALGTRSHLDSRCDLKCTGCRRIHCVCTPVILHWFSTVRGHAGMRSRRKAQHGRMLRLHRYLLAPRIAMMIAVLVALTGAAAHPDLDAEWAWPTEGARVVSSPFRAPAHEYGEGHRGIDLGTELGAVVRAPADGVVAFRGAVVDRPLLTIDHGAGIVSTFEPLESSLAPGTVIRTGDEIRTVAVGGHAAPGTLHVGVRANSGYINPMPLFGAVPRAVLLPCCDALARADPPTHGDARGDTSP